MTDKEIRKLSKTELLWIIRDQEEEILELKARLEALSPSSEADGEQENIQLDLQDRHLVSENKER